MSISISKLETFIKRGGYEIVSPIKRGRRKGQWTGVSKASRVTGISRPTIYKILEEHPEIPCKVKPKYVDNLEESYGYQSFIEKYGCKLNKNDLQQSTRFIREGFRKLDYKAPETWTIDDYRKLWHDKDFFNPECKGIDKYIAVVFRRMMRVTENFDLLEKFKYNSPSEGKKKQWFLHEDEIEALVRTIEEKETLLLLFVGISVGARHQALNDLRVKDIDFDDNVLQVHESKTSDYVLKFPPYAVFDLLKIYVEDLDLHPEDKIFPKKYDFYLRRLRLAGKKAKLKKRVSTHILKHTFVTQASRHRVSAENIVDQTGTELRTLEKFYRARDEAKLRHEMQGTDYKAIPFHEWIRSLGYIFRARYNQLRTNSEGAKGIEKETLRDSITSMCLV